MAAPKNNFEADDWVMRGKQPPKVKPVVPETKKTIAERNVALWLQNHPQKPTDEMYDAQIGYYSNLVAKAQDDYVIAFGQSSEVDASEKDWSDYSEKVDDYVTQRDAFNRAKMGVDTSGVVDNGGGGG